MSPFFHIEPLEDRIAPAVFLVTSLADSGKGTLRAALASADSHPGVDSIIFKLPAPTAPNGNVITLASPLTSLGGVKILGPGAGKLSISGNGAVSDLQFTGDAPGVDNPAAISGLSFINGNTAGVGGGILSNESLTLKNVVVSGNTAFNGGGVAVFGTSGVRPNVSLSNCTITENLTSSTSKPGVVSNSGGGIYLVGVNSVVIAKTTMARNEASSLGGGGFIFDLKSLKVTDTAISGNTAGDGVGGLDVDFQNNHHATASLAGCTVTGNTGLEVGGLNFDSYPGAIQTTTLKSCTISGNNSTGTSSDENGGGLHFYNGTNVVSKCTISGNQSANQGGGLFADQLKSLLISQSTFANNHAAKGGGALSIAGASNGTQAPAIITGSFFKGNVSSSFGGAIAARGGVSVSLAGTVMTGNQATADGGGLYVNGQDAGRVDVTMSKSDFSSNSASRGGGFYLKSPGGSFTATSCTISGNNAESGGGGAISGTSNPTLSNDHFNNNFVIDNGGGFDAITVQNLKITGGTFSGNIATNQGSFGGGLEFQNVSGTISKALISGNSTGGSGAGVYSDGNNSLTISSSKISNNVSGTPSGQSGSSGGGVSLEGGETMLINDVITNNSAFVGGGIAAANVRVLSVTGCVLTGNAASLGGGIEITSTSSSNTATITGSTITGNIAAMGGGVFNGGNTPASVFVQIAGIFDNIATTSGPNISGTNITTI